MKNTVTGILLTAVLLSGAAAHAADTRIAVVDMEIVMRAYPETESSQIILDQQIEEFESEQRQMLAEREDLEAEFREVRDKARNPALSEEAREKNRLIAEEKLEKLQAMERELRETASMRRKQLQDQQLRMRRRIVGKLRDIIGEHCKQAGIDLVLDSALPGQPSVESVVYSAPALDITEQVLALIKAAAGATGGDAEEGD